MKQTIFLLIIVSNFFYAQNIHVQYLNKVGTNLQFKEDLYITSKNVLSIRDSSLVGNINQNELISTSSNSAVFLMKEKPNQIVYFKNVKNKIIIKQYIDDDSYYIEDNLPQMKWDINHSETKKILGYLCNKATLKYRGSNITAYYTKKLPFNYGPFKFSGLNYVILEIQDNENTKGNSWTAISLEKNFKSNIALPTFPKNTKTISLKTFIELEEKQDEEMFNKLIRKGGNDVQISSKKFIRGGIEKKYEWEN